MVKTVRAARHYQRKSDPVRLLAERGIPTVRKPLRQAFDHLSDLVDVERLAGLIRMGFRARVADFVDFTHYREVLKDPFNAIGRVRLEAAKMGERRLNARFAAARRPVRFRPPAYRFAKDVAGVGDRFGFDMLDQGTQERVREAQDALIRQLEEDARSTIDAIVTSGTQSGLTAEEIATDIRDMISLTDTQARAVQNYRSMLESLDPQVLARQLRNTSADDEIRAALADGEALAAARITELVDDYTSNYLDYRAATIAQTESTRAANWGLDDAYTQAIERGAIPGDAVTRQWQLADHPCPVCESVPDLNPDGVGVDEAFSSSDGDIDNPPVHPNCMCSVDYVTDLDKVPD